ncbi:hypothetical protein HMPREF1544_06351 [Mucor circinelloides 1006PhL]|uniref:Uncharacterized protein n=1 Tax=Mucor circinelloides f. circinelloides (strain 1006PhL) TaxID=1220926 RepID=S2J9K1_MUCC1|nr:hypothetical protein HMPREF1544_06351 [Mucor circinelloides 1006PhL]
MYRVNNGRREEFEERKNFQHPLEEVQAIWQVHLRFSAIKFNKCCASTDNRRYISTWYPNVLATGTSVSSSDDTTFTLDFTRPTDNYLLIFMEADVSARFYEFQLPIKRKTDSKVHLTLEENVQHILALSSILLLKPARTHVDLHEYISLNTCDALPKRQFDRL